MSFDKNISGHAVLQNKARNICVRSCGEICKQLSKFLMPACDQIHLSDHKDRLVQRLTQCRVPEE